MENTTHRVCCICQGNVNVVGAQALSVVTPWGEFRVHFHSFCYVNNPDAAQQALSEFVEKNKPK